MKKYFGIILMTLVVTSCNGQSKSEKKVGGPCQDCEAVMDYKILDFEPKATVTLPKFENNEPKVKITGTVFEKDGKTPAENIILYVYHTDRNGIYQPSKMPIGWEKTHGQYRGWLKTDKDGKHTPQETFKHRGKIDNKPDRMLAAFGKNRGFLSPDSNETPIDNDDLTEAA